MARSVVEWHLSRVGVLLRQGKRLALVADEVGYSSYAALSRAFKQRQGVSPSRWLRRIADSGILAPNDNKTD